MAVALLVAAGSGERLGAGRPKAFVVLAGRPMIQWSLDAVRAAGVDDVVVAAPSDARIEDGALVIRVRDEGRGIQSGDLPRIFDRFTQIDGSSTRAHGGVGLGLHLVRELTRRAGGDVDVDSELGRGATFTVRIPLGEGAPDRDPSRPEMTTA
jgi:K+-sensing histidine kinase KdpD